jgi:hypothetical protein
MAVRQLRRQEGFPKALIADWNQGHAFDVFLLEVYDGQGEITKLEDTWIDTFPETYNVRRVNRDPEPSPAEAMALVKEQADLCVGGDKGGSCG